MKAGESTVMGPPLFHGTGLLLALIAVAVGNKLVLRTKFDPPSCSTTSTSTTAPAPSAWSR